jgi:hypothetical protein
MVCGHNPEIASHTVLQHHKHWRWCAPVRVALLRASRVQPENTLAFPRQHNFGDHRQPPPCVGGGVPLVQLSRAAAIGRLAVH